MINVTIINGGRGAKPLITELLGIEDVNLTSIVNAYDDGLSTGQIRKIFNILGPSDIRKVQELMLPECDENYNIYKSLFNYRYPLNTTREEGLSSIVNFVKNKNNQIAGTILSEEVKVTKSIRKFLSIFIESLEIFETANSTKLDFSDCSLMNCIYAGAILYYDRNIEIAAKEISRLFSLKGVVLPTGIENKKLAAVRVNGEVLFDEAEIVELRSNVKIEKIFLIDEYINKENFSLLSLEQQKYFLDLSSTFITISENVKTVLKNSDIIIFSAGTQHSSLYPSYISHGFADAIADNKKAIKSLIINIGADYETPSYKVSDYINGAMRYLSLNSTKHPEFSDFFDYAYVNNSSLKADETYVEFDQSEVDKIPVKIVNDCFEDGDNPGKHSGRKVISCIISTYNDSFRD